MDLFRRAGRLIPSGPPQLPLSDEKGGKKPRSSRLASRLAFFRRPLRLKGSSSISVPLGVVIIFPCIVVVLILVLFVRHPSSPGRILMPAGAPPAIRYVIFDVSYVSKSSYFLHISLHSIISPPPGRLTRLSSLEKLVKNMTKSSSQDVSNPTPQNLVPTPPSSCSPETRNWTASFSPSNR